MLLDVKNLSVTLEQSKKSISLVRNTSFSIEAGETLAIVGESGSGKSISSLALLDLLPKNLRKSADYISLNGQDLMALTSEQMRKVRGTEISMVFQEPMTALNPVRSIGVQMTERLCENMGMSLPEATRVSIELLEEVGVSDAAKRMKQYPHHFSGGMRQRVMIAIALSVKPKLIIADEPTTALDVTIQAQILDLMSELCRNHGVALILITHNLGIVARYANRVNVMYGGAIVETNSLMGLYKNPRHPYTLGLLRSVPRLDQNRSHALIPIEGTPADAFSNISGCRFHPRCPKSKDKCNQETPSFIDDVACHFPLLPGEVSLR